MVNDLFPLNVSGATCRRFGKTLVGPVDLSLPGDGTTVILGPNGAGKTTLLQLLHGTARLSRGKIEWSCETGNAQAMQSFVFQRPVMLRRSVEANLAYPLIMRKTQKQMAKKQAHDWADRVGLSDLLDQPAHSLSGGEQQKLAIARALITDPGLLFLDEPCAFLDGRAIREIETILGEAKSHGTRLILSTHDLGQARRLADDVVFLVKGRVAEHSPADTFFDNPKTAQAAAFLKGDIIE